MLNLRQVKHLARWLDTSVDRLGTILDDAESYYEELILQDPAKPDKSREVVCVNGAVRDFQSKLYRRVLLPKLVPSAFSHGGVRGRHIKTNIEPHRRSSFIFKTDVSNFYPTVHHSRIYRLFAGKFGCSPDVARLCARLCSYRHHLALGLITSPILADQIMLRVDARIAAACRKAGLVYTRFVDDVTISGPFNLRRSGFEKIVTEILNNDGFQANPKKHDFGELDRRTSITNVRVVRGHLDVRREYADELERQLHDAWCLANDKAFTGPYYTQGQIRGRVQFVCWINPRRRRHLMKKFTAISWRRVNAAARELGLVATKKTLHKQGELAAATGS